MAGPATPPATAADAARDIPVAVGDVIAEKYRVEKIVGAGGVGVVFAAEHLGLGEKVAIKLLQRSAAQSAENLARFDREARALARIKTDHVARIMDIGRLETGEPFMVMELLVGEDFASVLRARERIPIPEAVDYVVQACEGVALSHGLGIVHRDLKPANLFLTAATAGGADRRVVKVLDFGISKLRTTDEGRDQAVTQTLSVIGSPLYMSPEQMERPRDADERADVWSLGVILYELVTGKPPFEAPTLPILCARICTAPPTPLSVHGVNADGLEAVIARCLEKDPAKRYPTASELVRALAPFGAARSVEAEKPRAATLPMGFENDEATLVMAPSRSEEPTPESIGPRRMAWDSSPPPPRAQRPRRGSLWKVLVPLSAVLVAAIALVSLRAQSEASPRGGAERWANTWLLESRLAAEVSRRRAAPSELPVKPVEVVAVAASTTPVTEPVSTSTPAPSACAAPTAVSSVTSKPFASTKSARVPAAPTPKAGEASKPSEAPARVDAPPSIDDVMRER